MTSPKSPSRGPAVESAALETGSYSAKSFLMLSEIKGEELFFHLSDQALNKAIHLKRAIWWDSNLPEVIGKCPTSPGPSGYVSWEYILWWIHQATSWSLTWDPVNLVFFRLLTGNNPKMLSCSQHGLQEQVPGQIKQRHLSVSLPPQTLFKGRSCHTNKTSGKVASSKQEHKVISGRWEILSWWFMFSWSGHS